MPDKFYHDLNRWKTCRYLRTYHIGDYVHIRVNGAVHKDVLALILTMLVRRRGANLLVRKRYARLSCFYLLEIRKIPSSES